MQFNVIISVLIYKKKNGAKHVLNKENINKWMQITFKEIKTHTQQNITNE